MLPPVVMYKLALLPVDDIVLFAKLIFPMVVTPFGPVYLAPDTNTELPTNETLGRTLPAKFNTPDW